MKIKFKNHSFFLKAKTLKLKPSFGYSLIETLVYIFIMSLLLGALVTALISLTGSYKRVKSEQAIASASLGAMDVLVREIRDAVSVDSEQSVFGVSPGRLVLNTLDDEGSPATAEFYLNDGKIFLKRNGTLVGSLSPALASTTSLVFRLVNGTESKAVKLDMTVESGQGANYKSASFHSSAVMRGSYELQ